MSLSKGTRITTIALDEEGLIILREIMDYYSGLSKKDAKFSPPKKFNIVKEGLKMYYNLYVEPNLNRR